VRVLTVNAGSTSLKLERYELVAPLPPLAEPPVPSWSRAAKLVEAEDAIEACTVEPLDVAAHRFVRLPDGAPAVLGLDAAAIASIAAAAPDAPLHDAAALRAVACIARSKPELPQFAVGDSAFHRSMPEAATTYALPREVTRSGLRRLGYHGLSHEYAAHRACSLAGIDVETARVITAHLGGGSSLCAIRNGASLDTTMGYTPLEGLPMATRSGSVDPGLLLHLLRTGLSHDALEEMLERRSGLLGISGISGDVRELLSLGDRPMARLALDVLGWRLRSSLGAMVAVLGGVDLIAFTGGVGEHAAEIRAAALEGGLGLGAAVDAKRNAAVNEGRIDADGSPVAVCVVAAREGWLLARAAFAIVTAGGSTPGVRADLP
jgi:acetate kinase